MLAYLLLGVSTGMRTLTATAVLCWAAWAQIVPQHGWAFWAGNLVSAIVFTVMALGEYVGDTLPQTPNRTDWLPLGARIGFACLVGALAADGLSEPLAGGILFALAGVLIGAFGGYRMRMWLGKRVGADLPVALTESCVAAGLAIFAVYQMHAQLLSDAGYHALLLPYPR